MPTNNTIEKHEVGTPKDYAHQIVTAFKYLEHGISYFNGQPCMEAGEEDMLYDIITQALTQAQEKRDEQWRKHLNSIIGTELYKLHEKHFHSPVTPDTIIN